MKKKWVLATLVACAIALAGCKVVSEPELVAVESVTLNVTTLTLTPGATGKLTAIVKPDNADDKSVKWLSSNVEVAMVSSDGTVGAIKTGTTIITAQAGDKTAICVIIVNDAAAENPDSPIVNPDSPVVNPDTPVVDPDSPVENPDSPVAVDSITLSTTTLTIEPGKTRELKATVMPSNADDKTVTWSSSDENIATVSDDGTVVAIKTGTTIITAQAGDKTAICVIIVNDAAVVNPDSPVAVESVMLSTTTLTIAPGKTRTLTATVTPSNADDKTVIWSSSDENIATVSDDGTVTATFTEGTTTITAQAGGKTATCLVTVKPILIAVERVSLNTKTLTLTRGETDRLVATVTPDDADDTSVAWSSSDDGIATVDNDGTVTANKVGTTTISAQAGDITAECAITVNPIPVASVALDKATLMLTRGETGKLTATVTPANADDTVMAWSSSDTSVATVGSDGMVKAVAKGTATVTAQAGGKMATCEVTVNPVAVENVALDITAVTLELGMTRKLTATINPDNADDKTVKWSSSDTSVATVSNDGTVMAVNVGTATITARAGDKQATCMVTVKLQTIAVTSISLNWESIDISSGDRESLSAKVLPSNADDTTVVWSSSDTTVATISPGLTNNRVDVRGVKAGTATITARAGDKQATCKVTVHDHSYSGGKCTICGRKPYMANGTIDDTGVLTKYSGKEATVVIPEGVTSIGNSALKGCTSLASVTIPKSVTSIGGFAFYNCTSLASVTIPKSVTSIGDGAFEGCTSLTEMTIPDSVTSIGGSAFYGCTNLTSVKISNNLTSIGNNMFQVCENLMDITIPDSVTSIGKQAFCGCTNLTSVKIGNGVTSIEWYAFCECTSLTSVTIGDSVTTIGQDAFNGCTGLTSVTIPKSVTKIGNNAFYDCTNLKNVTYGGTKEKWEIIRKLADIGLLDENITITYKE